MSTKRVSQELSSDVVKHLQANGMKLKDIGKLTESSESYISRVNKGTRSFTLEHLLMLEKSLKKPLPILLVETMDRKSVPEEVKLGYEELRKLLNKQPALIKKLFGTA